MKNSGSIIAIIMVSILAMLVLLVGSIKKRPGEIETGATADEQTVAETSAIDGDGDGEYRPEVTTVIVDSGRLIVGTDNGLYMMPLYRKAADVKGDLIPQKRDLGDDVICLNAIIPLGEYRYGGGFGLYKLDSDYTTLFESHFPGETVNTLLEFGNGLLVGTDRGLWYHCDHPVDETGCVDTLLKDDVIVTAMALDQDGLWVGTYGDGLLYYDGLNWRERYLLRDTLSFAFVNALEFYYPYLWVGTDEAIYRYDGARWSQMFAADSSETYAVSNIMTTRAATYIGTEDGLLKFASDSLKAVEDFHGMAIAGLCLNKKDVIVATRRDGIFKFKGKEEIVSPEQLRLQVMAEVTNEEVLAETMPKVFAAGYRSVGRLTDK